MIHEIFLLQIIEQSHNCFPAHAVYSELCTSLDRLEYQPFYKKTFTDLCESSKINSMPKALFSQYAIVKKMYPKKALKIKPCFRWFSNSLLNNAKCSDTFLTHFYTKIIKLAALNIKLIWNPTSF